MALSKILEQLQARSVHRERLQTHERGVFRQNNEEYENWYPNNYLDQEIKNLGLDEEEPPVSSGSPTGRLMVNSLKHHKTRDSMARRYSSESMTPYDIESETEKKEMKSHMPDKMFPAQSQSKIMKRSLEIPRSQKYKI